MADSPTCTPDLLTLVLADSPRLAPQPDWSRYARLRVLTPADDPARLTLWRGLGAQLDYHPPASPWAQEWAGLLQAETPWVAVLRPGETLLPEDWAALADAMADPSAQAIQCRRQPVILGQALGKALWLLPETRVVRRAALTREALFEVVPHGPDWMASLPLVGVQTLPRPLAYTPWTDSADALAWLQTAPAAPPEDPGLTPAQAGWATGWAVLGQGAWQAGNAGWAWAFSQALRAAVQQTACRQAR